MNIGIFCSANDAISKQYFERTEEVARWCARGGHSIVFGGCAMGLMGCVARAFFDEQQRMKASVQNAQGGELIGVVPRLIEEGGRMSPLLTRCIPCNNLSDRKDLLLAHSDVIVALPGGIGTLDEIFTVAASKTIGYHRKQVILYHPNGFWSPLVALLESLQQKGMIRGRWSDYINEARTLDELASCVVG